MTVVRLFRWFIVRHLRRDPLRSAATVAGIALGVGVVLAIRMTNASSVRGFEAALDAVSGRTSLEVTAPGVAIDETRLTDLGWLRAFGRVSPVIDADVPLRVRRDDPDAVELVRILGVDILRDQPFRSYPLVDTGAEGGPPSTQAFLTLLTDPGAIVLTRTMADRFGLAVGDRVELVVGGRAVPLVVRGLLGGDGPASLPDGNFALMDIAAAQLALGRLGEVDRVDIQLGEGIDVAAADQAVAARLPEGLGVQRPARRGAEVERMLAAFHFNLDALSYIALLVGLFLVYNTVSVSVIARRAEIGMLRTVGASRRLVLALFLGEALALGVLGCALGAPLGWGLAHGAVRLTSSTVSRFWVAAAADVPALDAGYVALAFGIGVPLALLAAIVPAAEAARLPPVAAVRNDVDADIRFRLPRRFLLGALGCLVAAAWLATRPAVDGLPVFGFLSALAVVLGATLLVPVVLYALQRWTWPSSWQPPVEALLARANLASSIRRVSVSVAALAVSLAMMVAIAVMVGSFRETVTYWVGQTLRADLLVSTGRPARFGDRPEISVRAEETMAAHPAVAAIDAFRSVDLSYHDALIVVGSGRFPVLLDRGHLVFKAPADGTAALRGAVGRDAVVVSESFALKFGAAPGGTITLPTRDGDRPFDVVGVYYDYSSDRGTVVMDAPVFSRFFDDRRPSSMSVYLAPGSDAGVVRDDLLRALGPDEALFINTNAAVREQVLEVFDSTFGITWALEAVAIVVAMFGVAATLLTLALERRRETAMLRLAGADRRRLRRMIMIEAGMLGLVSQGIGLVVGLILSLLLIYVINVQSFGWTIQFHLPVLFLVQATLLIVAATVLAGLYPARLAGRAGLADLTVEE